MSPRIQLPPGTVDLLWWPAAATQVRDRAQLACLLRSGLAEYVGLDPADLRFAREARGRPFLKDGPAGLEFSLSDTRGGSLLAVAMGLRVGVDLERSDRQMPAIALARRYFSTAEAAALADLPEHLQTHAFVYAWTAKEAACKATGTGLRNRLAAWCFEADSVGADPRLSAAPAEAGSAQAWSFRRLQPAPTYTAVVAAAGRIRDLRLRAGPPLA